MEQAVRGLIANLRQLGGGEIARQTGAHRTVKGQGGTVYHVRVGDFMLRQLDANMGAIVLIQQGQLFEQIVAEQFRVGDGGGIAPGMGETSRARVLRAL